MITTFIRKYDQDKLYGYIIKRSNKLTLIEVEKGFLFDGFAVLKNSTIRFEEITDSNKYCSKLIRTEKQWPVIPTKIKNLNISSWASALSEIKSIVILEDEKNGSFDIGSLTEIGKVGCKIQNFNGVGEWTNLESIKYNKITICKFQDRYSSTHAKYLKWNK